MNVFKNLEEEQSYLCDLVWKALTQIHGFCFFKMDLLKMEIETTADLGFSTPGARSRKLKE